MLTPNQQLQHLARFNSPEGEMARIKLRRWAEAQSAQRRRQEAQHQRVLALRRQRLERCL